MTETLFQAAAMILPLVFAIVFHEVAHGYVARLLGDPTASQLGRLSLNPLRHVDPIGTLVLPGMLALAGMPVFGWAKPVPVVAQRLRNPRRDMMLVAIAGPGSNLLLAGAAAVALGLMTRVLSGAANAEAARFVLLNLFYFIQFNVFLAMFNLLPIPPFDGSHVVEGLLPRRAAAVFSRLRQQGFMLVLVLLILLPRLIPGFDPVGRVVGPPVEWLLGQYYSLVAAVAGV